ncbi:hypothetical protein CO038_04625 [Candidatus Pacearchaeota archaeon CG_4_9_14_0_2_um_filter_39_13]|nr:MAG: hypothetical protein CO038_04625 [Candidatus Pacearchaeota archaeon CG_4_9_14_0_2_um_filter_39_13]
MARNRLAAGLLSALLASGCESEEIYQPLLGMPSPNINQLEKMTSHPDPCPICRDLNSETIESMAGTYEGYSVEVVIKESRWGEPIGERQRIYRINLLEHQNNNLVAEIRAGTDWDSELPFKIYSKTIPEGHPFSQYTPEKIKEIYDLIISEKKQ